jgi:NAD(P)H-quinone oxidoreductase subunit 6
VGLADAVFYLIAGITVGSAAVVAFARNIVYSAVALLGTFAGIVGLYFYLAADFVAVVQLLVYIGGILVLTIFAVMLTHRIADVKISNRAVAPLPALALAGVIFLTMARAIFEASWKTAEAPAPAGPTTYAIGDAFLGPYVLPFELASLVLLAAVIGSIVLSRKAVRE